MKLIPIKHIYLFWERSSNHLRDANQDDQDVDHDQLNSQPGHSGTCTTKHHAILKGQMSRGVDPLGQATHGHMGRHRTGSPALRDDGIRFVTRHPRPMTLLPPGVCRGSTSRRRADCDSTRPSRPFLPRNYQTAHVYLVAATTKLQFSNLKGKLCPLQR